MPPRTLARIYWLVAAVLLTTAIVCSQRFIAIPFPFTDDGFMGWIIVAAVIGVLGTLVIRFVKDVLWAAINGKLATIRLYVKNPEVFEQTRIAGDSGDVLGTIRQRLAALAFTFEERMSDSGDISFIAHKPKRQDASGLLFNAMELTADVTSAAGANDVRVHLRMLGSFTGSVAIDYEQLRSVADFVAGAGSEVNCDALPVTIDMSLIFGTAIIVLGLLDQLHGRILGLACALGSLGIVTAAMASVTLKRMQNTTVGWPAAIGAGLLTLWPALARLLALLDPRWLNPPTSWLIAAVIVAPLIAVPMSLAITGNRINLPQKPIIPMGWTNVSRLKIFAGTFFAMGLFLILAGAWIVVSTFKMDARKELNLSDAEKGGPLPVGWVDLHGWIDLDHYVWHTDDRYRDNYLPMHGVGSASQDPVVAFLRIPGSKGEELTLSAEELNTAVSGIAEEEQLPTNLDPWLQREGIKAAPRYVILQYHLDPAKRREGGFACAGMGLLFAALGTIGLCWKSRKKTGETQTRDPVSSVP